MKSPGISTLIQHEYEHASCAHVLVKSSLDTDDANFIPLVLDRGSARRLVIPILVHKPMRPGLAGALHAGARRCVDILREAPVEFDVQRACRATLPLSVGDPVPLADDLDVSARIFRSLVPSPATFPPASGEQRADRSPSRGFICHRREVQRAPQPIRVVPVIEQVLRSRISSLESSSLSRDRAIATATAAAADQARRE